jgi:flagellar hook-associated protein 2
VNVDASGAETLEDIAQAMRDALGAANLNVTVGYDRTGTRLQLSSGESATISASGALADALGLSGSGTTIQSTNLQRRYVDENTTLEGLRNGRGISQGQIRITTASGGSAVLDLRTNPPKTVGELMASIAALGIDVRAEINENGDGIKLIDESRGDGVFKVVDESGTAAKDLNIAGEVNGAEGARSLVGSFEYRIDLGPSGTLQDLARRISETGLADASVLNDGAALTPYRLSIASRASGLAGELIVSSDDPAWELNTLTRAQDAAVIVGADSGGGLLVTSSSNTIRNALGGLTLDLLASSNEPVTVQVSQTQEAAVAAMKGLLDGFNAALERISSTSSYDSEKQQRGILLGESAPREAQRRLFDLFTRPIPGATGSIRRLTDLGFKVGSGAKLSFDEEKFKEIYAENPDAVTKFFTDTNTGAGKYLNDKLKEITQSDGLLDRRSDALADMKESMQSRVDSMNAKLERKRERLMRQFQAMEQTLALLQGQQASLSSFSMLPTGSSGSR